MKTSYIGAGVGGGGIVTSVFGRIGAVVATLNDYAASLINNDSGVSGASVKDALDNLLAAIPSVPVSSVFGRTGAVVAALNDYAASLITNDSGVAGATVKAALDNLLAAIPSVPVSSVFSRTGAVVAALNDYAASLVSNDSSVSGATVKDALNNLVAVVAGLWVYYDVRGCGAAPGDTVQRYIPRTNSNTSSVVGASEFPIGVAGTFKFTLTWRLAGTPLATRTVRIELYKNGVATGIFGTIPAATAGSTGQITGNITTAIGDGIAVGLLQSGAETQANWLLCTELTAVVP